MNNFKVLTLNIHKGFSAGNRRFTLERIRHRLRETGSNIVFLQEVTGENEIHRESISDWPDKNQFEYLADSVWDHFAYGKNAIYQHGHHGNAILSELPFASWNNLNVSTLSFSPRGILHGVLENNVHLLCVHFGLFEKERKQQIAQLISHINSDIPDSAPLILAGDFNDWRGTSHAQLIQETGLEEASMQYQNKLAKTFPAFLPCLTMDRIYLRGFNVNHVEIMDHSSWRSISDHCAIVAELQLKQQIAQ
jgi:endonuclease/exonuclease/phosphatase family metal-dependent hydrolase